MENLNHLSKIITNAVSKENATHFKWGAGCEGWWLLCSKNLAIAEEHMPSNTSEKRHYHEFTHQFFYVLEGDLVLEIAGQRNNLSPNQGISVPAKQPHKVLNESTQSVRFLVIASSNHKDDRVDLE